MDKIILGYAPTRRNVFSATDALKYRRLIKQKLLEMNIDIVDIDDINDEGLLYDDKDVEDIINKFRKRGVDGIIFPHCNFGTEYLCARVAKGLGVPVMLWGPLDERPLPDGTRLRDTQCGLFATGKVFRRFQIPFTYMTNCSLDNPVFERGIYDFMAVCNVVKKFRNIRILQISTRPFDFWSTMCNEGELLEKFNIQLSPIPITELKQAMETVKKDEKLVRIYLDEIYSSMEVKIDDSKVIVIAQLAAAVELLVNKYKCDAVAMQCWNALQDEIGIMPCAANALLNEKGIPVVCETDIHGAVTQILIEAAAMGEKRGFFADWTVRHPDCKNAELLQHCGPWPVSVAKTKPQVTYPIAFDYAGSLTAQAKDGDITICRFDGDNGEYSLLLGNAHTVEGPACKGTYMWIEVDNINRLEAKLVEGPYIHHCSGIHKDVVAILYEACKYIGVKPDLFDPVEEQIKEYLRGE